MFNLKNKLINKLAVLALLIFISGSLSAEEDKNFKKIHPFYTLVAEVVYTLIVFLHHQRTFLRNSLASLYSELRALTK